MVIADVDQVQKSPTLIYLETYGCQMNEYDSKLVQALLTRGPFEFTEDMSKANWVILNTCAVRENAQQRIYSRLRHIKQHCDRQTKVGIIGCMAQSLQAEIVQRESMVSLIAGPDSYRQLPFVLHNANEPQKEGEDQQAKILTQLDNAELYDDIIPDNLSSVTSYITIMRGCNNFCSFCVVPYTRGRERSRDPKQIISEVRHLQQSGVKEITLLGQNVNSYHFEQNGQSYHFSDLIRLLAHESAIRRIRFTSPHPKDFPESLLTVMANYENICPHIHLPLQSGSDRILHRMKRGYTIKEYLNLVALIRQKIANVALSTDVIFGFPGETEQEAQQTMDVMEECRFNSAFIFKYSQRPNTLAARQYADDVSDKDKSRRVFGAVAAQNKRSLQYNQELIGSEMEVLIEKVSKKSEHDLMGRTTQNHSVVLARAQHKIGDFVKVQIMGATSATLLARIKTTDISYNIEQSF